MERPINSKNKETARRLMPLLDNIDSVLSETDRKIEALADKKLKLEQLKTSIAQSAQRHKPLSNDEKQLLETDWKQSVDNEVTNILKPIKITATIANIKDIKNKSLLSDKYHVDGLLFVLEMKLSYDGWIDVCLHIDSVKSRGSNVKSEIEFQCHLLSSDPAKTVKPKILQRWRSPVFCGCSSVNFVLLKDLLEPANGFMSKDGLVTVEIDVKTFRFL